MTENGENTSMDANHRDHTITDVIFLFGEQKLKSSFQKSPSNFLYYLLSILFTFYISLYSYLTSEKIEGKLIEEPKPEMIGEIDGKEQEIVNRSVPKQFVLKFVFEDVSSWKDGQMGEYVYEEYFGAHWCIKLRRNNEDVQCYLICKGPESNWAIEAEYVAKTIGPANKISAKRGSDNFSGEFGYGWDCFLKWNDMVENYLVNNTLKVEINVKIKRISGIYKENQRKFDESTKDVSDVVLMVNGEKFFVSKYYLAAQSSYFKSIFLQFKKPEISLNDVDPTDFQKYLEVLYGESAIDGDKLLPNHNKRFFIESSVEGLLLVAETYKTQIVVRKCEEFLLKEAETTKKKKLQMAFRYNLHNLKVSIGR
ncbi:hypothetical protein CAEBREN_11461 [Caenorhabditis brenneri]|uniref:BTB domain-containing protein n=1 Tax=Caenorhabditis brenneri TaxID=135651 RepID=G0NR76_CAEBE|nr:hypothetical protein CAEBREN_11461 [Caenorhabditis brenneri]